MLERRSLRVLAVLDTSKRRQEIAEELEYHPDTVTQAVTELQNLGLVNRKSRDGERVIVPTDARCVELFQTIVKEKPYIDFPDLLSPSIREVLYYLSPEKEWSAAELTERVSYSRATVYRKLKTLTNRAIVTKDHGQYRLSEEFSTLHQFAWELRHQYHRSLVRENLDRGTLVWEDSTSFVARSESTIDEPNYTRTGLDAFSSYGLEFFTTSGVYYFYTDSEEELSPADIACHLLLIDNDSRHRKYALLLIVKTDVSMEVAREAASRYKVLDTMEPLLKYLETEGKKTTDWTPPWEEMQSLANEYEVTL
mgnify:CR=1 FL=1